MTMQESLADADFLFQPELLLRCVHEINLLTQDGKNLVGQQWVLTPFIFSRSGASAAIRTCGGLVRRSPLEP